MSDWYRDDNDQAREIIEAIKAIPDATETNKLLAKIEDHLKGIRYGVAIITFIAFIAIIMAALKVLVGIVVR